MKTTPLIEPLEPRIAPASVTITPATKTATWTDWDGDLVTLKYSSADAPTFAKTDKGAGLLVDEITLTAAKHSNADFTLTVKAAAGGDGHVDLGHVDATGVPLKSWKSPAATIAEFDCGDGAKAIGTFESATLGAVPVSKFNAANADGECQFEGTVTSLTVRGDVAVTELHVGSGTGKVKAVKITGSLRGDLPGFSGYVTGVFSPDGACTIGGSILGGENANDGALFTGKTIGKLTIKGSIVGGSENNTGIVFANTGVVGSVSIGGSIVGGSHEETGYVSLGGKVATFKLGGSVVGAGFQNTGFIRIFDTINSFTVGGNVEGGTFERTGVVTLGDAATATIKGSILGGTNTQATGSSPVGAFTAHSVKTLTVGGDVIAGSYGTGTKLGYNGAILISGNLGTATIKGSVLGHENYHAIIMAGGIAPAAAGNYNAIGKLTIGGDASLAYIAAGHTQNDTAFADRIGTAENPDAGIGSVTVGGNWFHSSLNAGINDMNTSGINDADTRDTGNANRHAVLGPVVIKGLITDNPALLGVSGFAAEKIASITAHGVKVFKTGDAAKSLDSFGYVDVAEI
jgi:hypothetical protein